MSRTIDCPRCGVGEVEILSVARRGRPDTSGLGGDYPGDPGGVQDFDASCDCPDRDEDGFIYAINEAVI